MHGERENQRPMEFLGLCPNDSTGLQCSEAQGSWRKAGFDWKGSRPGCNSSHLRAQYFAGQRSEAPKSSICKSYLRHQPEFIPLGALTKERQIKGKERKREREKERERNEPLRQ